MKQFGLLYLLAALAIGCASENARPPTPAVSQERHEAQTAMPKMSDEEMMQKMKEASTPGEAHRQLDPLIGTWRTETKWWKSPESTPEVSKGSASNHWVLGKRFIEQRYRGKMMGQGFEGQGLLGYDNVKKQYVSDWADSMGTGIMTAFGSFTHDKVLEMSGTFSCPMRGGDVSARLTTRIIDNNNHVFEIYGPGPDGREFKGLEITYKRRR